MLPKITWKRLTLKTKYNLSPFIWNCNYEMYSARSMNDDNNNRSPIYHIRVIVIVKFLHKYQLRASSSSSQFLKSQFFFAIFVCIDITILPQFNREKKRNNSNIRLKITMCAKYSVYQNVRKYNFLYIYFYHSIQIVFFCCFFSASSTFRIIKYIFFSSISICAVETHFLTNMTNMLLLINKNTRFNV